MKKVLPVVILGLSIASFSSPAAAGDGAKEAARLRKVVFDYASCVVRNHHAQASEAILATSGNSEIMSRYSQIIDSDCLENAAGSGVDMRFPNDTYRNALADALVNADFKTRSIASFADRLPLAQPAMIGPDEQSKLLSKISSKRKQKEMKADFEKQNELSWISRYGECVVRQDPEASRYWLLTPADTPEETSRIKALQPAFAGCLDGTMKFTRTMMRGTVAINYYRLAMATSVTTAGSML